jgi:eukaryotic-like serine/threonine-protein kinase
MNDEPTRVITSAPTDPEAVTRVPGGSATPGLALPAELTAAPGAAGPPAPETVSRPNAAALLAEPPPYGIPAGSLLANTYRVERLLGGGGMGEVYLTCDERVGVKHAVKVIRPAMAVNRQVMDLFYREAKVLRGVRHDAVVSYDGFVRDAEGRDYLVMEYVEGPSLADRLRQGPLPAEEVLTLRDRLAAGLAEAHRKGAIHRDISPDNVILPGGEVAAAKLIDFGLCKLSDPAQETIIGSSFAGKFRFASPEQFGLQGGEVDGRSDIYSLGLILAAAARGRPLDMGESFEAALRSRQAVPDLGEVPESLRPWLAAMLEPVPARRPPDLETLLTRWPAATRVTPLPRSDAVRPSQPAPPAGRVRRTWLLGGVGLVLLGGAAVGLYQLLQPLSPIDSRQTGTQQGGTSGPAVNESKSTGTQEGDVASLIRAGRDDQALGAAQAVIAARSAIPPGAGPGLPADAFLELAGRLRAAGRPQDAFSLVEAVIAAGEQPPTEDMWALARDLRAAGRLDPWFFLVRDLANRGYGPAAFAMGEMYDPLHWSAGASPLPHARADKAREWYERARELGVADADVRLGALTSAAPGD